MQTDLSNNEVGKQWWAPVWTGLVMDKETKHFKKMKNAVWLYLYLLLNAKRSSGFLKRKLKTISLDMGVNRHTVIGWLNNLRKHGYVGTQNTGRCLLIQIHKWKTFADSGNSAPQRWRKPHFRVTETRTPYKPRPAAKSASNWAKVGEILKR